MNIIDGFILMKKTFIMRNSPAITINPKNAV
jgi:hypothetical protein